MSSRPEIGISSIRAAYQTFSVPGTIRNPAQNFAANGMTIWQTDSNECVTLDVGSKSTALR